jgi:ferredoxin
MNVNRVLWVGDTEPVQRLRNFLAEWWIKVGLSAMLAPVELEDSLGTTLKFIEDPKDLALVNPFIPLMTVNAASLLLSFTRANNSDPGRSGLVAAILRPCELRTVVELQKKKKNILSNFQSKDQQTHFITIGVDCPGTYGWDEFDQRVKKLGLAKVTTDALAYGDTSIELPAQLRQACQICDWPAPWNADLTIGTIGTAPHQYLLLIARDDQVNAGLALEKTTDRLATEREVIRREIALGHLIESHTLHRARLDAPGRRPLGDLCNLLAFFARCTLCTDCLDACPLYEGELSSLLGISGNRRENRPALVEIVAVSRWLASCSGCGMCEEACQQHIPLTHLIYSLSHHIREELKYTAGMPEQELPWMMS